MLKQVSSASGNQLTLMAGLQSTGMRAAFLKSVSQRRTGEKLRAKLITRPEGDLPLSTERTT